MKTKITTLFLGVGLLFAGCSKDDDTSNQSQYEVQLKVHSSLGKILTDKEGRTLYYFANDYEGKNSCVGGCETLWPIFEKKDLTQIKVSEGLNIVDFGTTTTASGKRQVTFKGYPLYYYAPSSRGTNLLEKAGETKGEGVNNVWFVAKPDYTIMLANAQLIGHDGKNYTPTYTEGKGKTLYFTDSRGITLYTFKNDKRNKNNFTKLDFSNNGVWPMYEETSFVVPSSLDKSLFGSIDVNGKKQMTYKGWPLYYFGQDKQMMGSNKGVSFPVAGGVWPVVYVFKLN